MKANPSELLRAAAALPCHGHNSWNAPATLSPEEQTLLNGWLYHYPNDDDVDRAVMWLLGDRGPAVKAWAEAEAAETTKGWACSCGCGCKRRHHHPTSSYCPACREGRCGE